MYSCVISLGHNCGASSYLRGYAYQDISYPFDWVQGVDISVKLDLILNDFEDFFEKENLKNDLEGSNQYYNVYYDSKTGISLPHEFSVGGDFFKEYALAKVKYNRRIARLYKDIEKFKNITFFAIVTENDPVDIDLLKQYCKKLSLKFNKKIDIVVFKHSNYISKDFCEQSGAYIYYNSYLNGPTIMGDFDLISKDLKNNIKYSKMYLVKLKRLSYFIRYRLQSCLYIFNRKKRKAFKEKMSYHFKYSKSLKKLKNNKN